MDSSLLFLKFYQPGKGEPRVNFLFIFFGFLSQAQVFYPQRVIDHDDFILVQEDLSNIPTRYHRAADSVGRLSVGCTATHLGHGYAISAGHCFGAKAELSENQSCAKVTVSWGYRGSIAATLVSKCKKVVMMQDADGSDFALFQVQPFPEAFLEIEPSMPVIENLVLSLFSHPNGQPLTWSQLCSAKMRNTPLGTKPSLYHLCDTDPGSSGAALLDDATQKILAIHSGSGTYRDIGIWNYSTLIMNTPVFDYLQNLKF